MDKCINKDTEKEKKGHLVYVKYRVETGSGNPVKFCPDQPDLADPL